MLRNPVQRGSAANPQLSDQGVYGPSNPVRFVFQDPPRRLTVELCRDGFNVGQEVAKLDQTRISPDYSWTGVWRMSGVDHTRTLTREYSYRCFPSWSGIEIHLSGERRVSPNARVELALHASACGEA